MARGGPEVADVFRRYGEAYRQRHGASLLLQGYAQEGLDIPRGPTPTKEAAEVAPHPQPRGGAAFPPLCTPT